MQKSIGLFCLLKMGSCYGVNVSFKSSYVESLTFNMMVLGGASSGGD